MLSKIRATPKRRLDGLRGHIQRWGRWTLLVVPAVLAAAALWITMQNPVSNTPDHPGSGDDPDTVSTEFPTPVLPRQAKESGNSASPNDGSVAARAKARRDRADAADDDGLASSDRESRSEEDSRRSPVRTITGTVLDDTGVPLVGIEIGAEFASDARAVAAPTLRTVTDAAGMFEFQPGEVGEYRLHVAESSRFHEAFETVRTGTGTVDIILRSKRSVRIAGMVRDPQGLPIADARIRPLGAHGAASSDETGEYAIDVESAGAGHHIVLRFSRKGFRTDEHRVDLRSDDSPVELHVELQPLGSPAELFGLVTGRRGEPVPGAEVRLRSPSTGASRRRITGPDGEYRFEALEQGSAYRIDVRTADGRYKPYSSEPIALQRAQVALDITLQDGGQASLAGSIVDPGGKPLRDFDLWLRSLDAARSMPLLVRSDASGRFEPVSLPAGRLRMQSRSQPRIELSGLDLDPGEFLEVQLPVDWGERWLFGRVTDPSDRAIRGARVTLQWTHRQGELHSLSQRTTRTDFDGYFSFGNLAGDVYNLIGSAPGFGTRRIDVRPAIDEDVALVLSPQR